MADGQRVKLMSDYGAGWPPWSAQEGLLAPESLLLSAVHVTLDAWPVSDPELVAWFRHRH